ncbi:isopentenyl-diphosphate delta-isomerase [Microbacterium endophyticum]|uniref:Isopentenyl-diphosphate Delta-isomerase n=1 Tax=Microbacterium endophyticum TaxID=1526412 RepID=A0A7W4V1U6_9MICO|nr:isopentenyl-diphosphate Delta-isomerase [Microbacterium endophyticum]MBB2974750.1 isopentenyl-diphosphate delta-isomerase [Microbacterium endophyticum]NIK37047.1 isopentenyl-diphosphate delta-isomerase [Microbacterium endophyticum]
MSVSEEVVLLDEDGRATGTASKISVHGIDTPLHLAFSCHVLNARGEVLVTRRALTKLTWPGVWTNSFCGHPQPGEDMADAVKRRAAFELGLEISQLSLELPDFRYRAVDASGIVENEICPVFIARADVDPQLNPHEVVDSKWATPDTVAAALTATPWAFSPWLVLQAQQLRLFTEALTHADAS